MFLTDEFFMLRAVVDFDKHVNDKDFFAIIQTVKCKEYVHVQMALPKMCCFSDEILLAGAAVPLFNSYK